DEDEDYEDATEVFWGDEEEEDAYEEDEYYEEDEEGEFEEDEYLTEDFSPYLYDLDQDALTLSVSGNVNVTVSIVEFEVTFGSVQDWNGTETLTFTVDDSQGRLIASDDVDVIVTPVNDAPVLTDLSSQATDEDTPLTVTLSASDLENDGLTYSAVSDNENVSISVTGDQLTMTPFSN
ncbi:MAG: Ig-like domain-containing protein, partial [Candidatus Marinimicrobia bacterium]|nr:Ig-like domain-containing protein [Candidatus Neomarinimicrobiota bacterium]